MRFRVSALFRLDCFACARNDGEIIIALSLTSGCNDAEIIIALNFTIGRNDAGKINGVKLSTLLE